MTANAGHVFVSHSSDNRELAQELAAFIEARGVKVWIAPRDVRPGMDYSEQLQLAIETCLAFVVLVTDMANKSPYVRAETEMAFSTHKPIFPVRISDIQPAAGLAFFLKIRHWTDAFGAGKSVSLDRLTRELQTLSGSGGGEAAQQAGAPPPASPSPSPAPAPSPSPPPAAPARQAEPAAVAAVAAAPPLPLAPATAQDEEKWRAAVGPKADYYLERWRRMEAKGTAISWNWPACLANLYWLAYRKLWLPLAGLAAALVVLGVIGSAGPALGTATALLSIGLTFVTGSFGNHLYRKQVARLVAETSGMEQAGALDRLRSRGGVSVAALVIAIAVTVVLTLLMVLATAIAMQRQAELGSANRIEGEMGGFDAGGSFDPSQGLSGQTGEGTGVGRTDAPPPDDGAAQGDKPPQ